MHEKDKLSRKLTQNLQYIMMQTGTGNKKGENKQTCHCVEGGGSGVQGRRLLGGGRPREGVGEREGEQDLGKLLHIRRRGGGHLQNKW